MTHPEKGHCSTVNRICHACTATQSFGKRCQRKTEDEKKTDLSRVPQSHNSTNSQQVLLPSAMSRAGPTLGNSSPLLRDPTFHLLGHSTSMTKREELSRFIPAEATRSYRMCSFKAPRRHSPQSTKPLPYASSIVLEIQSFSRECGTKSTTAVLRLLEGIGSTIMTGCAFLVPSYGAPAAA
jgi:hypothetical protein